MFAFALLNHWYCFCISKLRDWCAELERKTRTKLQVKAGNKQAAYECYQRAVDISPATANDFAKVCKQDKLELQVSCTSATGSQSLSCPWFRLGQQRTCLFHMHISMATMQYNFNAFALVRLASCSTEADLDICCRH